MFYLKLLGAGVLLLGAFYISREYSAYLDRRLWEYEALCAMLSGARERGSGRSAPADFADECLERCGILSALREGKDLFTAFTEGCGGLSLSREARDRLSERLSDLRSKSAAEAQKLIGEIEEALRAELATESALADKNRRIVRALLIGGALAVGVMLI